MTKTHLSRLSMIGIAIFSSIGAASGQDLGPLQDVNANIARIIDPGGQPQPGQIQVSTLPSLVSWDEDGGKYAFNQMCNAMSAWGPTVKSDGIALSRRYEQYLMGINVVSADPKADEQQRKQAAITQGFQEKYNAEQLRLLSVWNARVAAEANVPPAMRTSYSSFMQQNAATLVSYDIAITGSYGTWLSSAQAAAPSTAGRALADLLGPQFRVKLKTYSGAELSVLECSPNIDLKQALADAQKQIDTGTAVPLVLGFGKDTGVVTSSSQTWGGSAGWGPWSVSASNTKTEYHKNTNGFHMRLEIPVVLRFGVVRPWLDLSLVQTYKDGSIRKGSELEKLKPLFGDKGSFSLVPQEYVVAYRPRVTIRMESSDYSLVKSAWSGGGSFGIGPFSVGGSASGNSSVEKWDDQNSEVTIGMGVNSFVLLGVRNKVLP